MHEELARMAEVFRMSAITLRYIAQSLPAEAFELVLSAADDMNLVADKVENAAGIGPGRMPQEASEIMIPPTAR